MLSTIRHLALRQTIKKSLTPHVLPPIASSSRSFHNSSTLQAGRIAEVNAWSGVIDKSLIPSTKSTTAPSASPVVPPVARQEREDPSWGDTFKPLYSTNWGSQRAAREQMPPERVWKERENNIVPHLPQPQGPYTGRTVYTRTSSGNSFTYAYNKLQRILKENNVRRELILAQRHEKKGVKRRRLSSERWRKRFAHEVRLKVKMVQEIRARGA